MAVIKSGASSDQLTVGPTSKAARVTLYDDTGQPQGQKRTYRAATTALLVAATTVNVPWLVIQGSATTTVRIQRITLTGLSLTAVAYLHINCAKYSTNFSGGTSTLLTQTPVDSNYAAATLNAVRVFTAGPTAGTKVGDIASRRPFGQATTAAAAGIPEVIEFDFRNVAEQSAVVLRGTTQELGVYWQTAPGSAVSMLLEVEWTEET